LYRVCKVCGAEFDSKKNGMRYCSPACKSTALHQRNGTAATHESRVCPVCGSVFVTSRRDQTFCSVNCRVKNHRSKKHERTRISQTEAGDKAGPG
jgi:predicted nucleic acid-binding Zn ribbon protein